MLVIVTGGSGKLGRETIRQLLENGHEVINLDLSPPKDPLCKFMPVDFTDYGQVVESFTGIEGGWNKVDAIIHLAAIPGPSHASNARLYANNSVSTFNVFWAAKFAGVRNIVWASSETLTGIPFEDPPPYLPVDEDTPRRPNSAYSLAKLVDEIIAEEFCRWDPELKMIGLRYSYVKAPDEFAAFEAVHKDPKLQVWNFWSYVDVRDAASATVLALNRQTKGLETYIIASPDTVMDRPTMELLAEYYPNVPVRRTLDGYESALASEKAIEALGWRPKHGWRVR